MKLKLISAVVTLLLASTAFATPILFTLSGSYAFININGVQQPSLPGLPYSHLYIGLYTDTSDFTTHHYTSRYGDSTYYSDTITGAILYDSSGKTPLATITDPIELRIYYPDIGQFTLMDVSTDPNLHDGATLADGTVNSSGSRQRPLRNRGLLRIRLRHLRLLGKQLRRPGDRQLQSPHRDGTTQSGSSALLRSRTRGYRSHHDGSTRVRGRASA